MQVFKLTRPHDFPEPSFATIANYGAADFPRHGDSEPLLAAVVFQDESRKERRVKLLALLVNSAELLTVAQFLQLV